jgi:aspartate beta-hydroxylase
MSQQPIAMPAGDGLARARQLARTGHLDEAVSLLTHLSHADPNDAAILIELGLAYQSGERYDAARFVFERAIEASGGDAVARLHFGRLLEVDDRPEQAMLQNFRALMQVQQTRRPLDAREREMAEHADRFVQSQRRAWFDRAVSGLRAARSDARWDRVDAALAVYLRERPMPTIDSRRRAGFMFVPDLESSPFPSDARVATCLSDSAAITSLRDEIDAICGTASSIVVFERGIAHYAARTKAPHLIAALNALPLAHVANHAPDCEIVTLPPNASTQRLFGAANSRWRIIVNLGKSPLQASVGGESRSVNAGASLALDATFGVEYANTAARSVRFIVFDVWHPDLSSAEREALAALMSAAVMLDTQVMDLP